MYTEYTYGFYLVISIALTMWVARTLHRNGRVFLIEAFSGKDTLADSVNHLLVVGFYLINFGYVALALKYGDKPANFQQAIEFLSTKVGFVLVVLGSMHFFNLFIFNRLRQRAIENHRYDPRGSAPPPPVMPQSRLTPSPEASA